MSCLSIRREGREARPPLFSGQRGCWRLAQLHGEVIVRTREAGTESLLRIALGGHDCLLFKLSGRELNHERHVKWMSWGSYLVIAPATWQRDEEKAGPAPATPESVSLEGYQAHFFDFAGGLSSSVAFRDPTGRAPVIGSPGTRFQLVGEELPDASENLGPLFGGSPPRVGVTHGHWESVGTIVLGVEGSGRGRWRVTFDPNPALPEQDLPAEFNSRKAGWYFARFYDHDGELIESLDFRYVAGLTEIRVVQPRPLPSDNGHRDARVEFLHDGGVSTEATNGNAAHLRTERREGSTIIAVPADAGCDLTHWLIRVPGGASVPLAISIERIWWAKGEENAQPPQWIDQRAVVSREDMEATSKRALWVRLPAKRWTDCVLFGFRQSTARRYPVLATTNTVAVPLRDFGDAPEMQRVGAFPLCLWVNHNTETLTAFPCELLVKATCKFDEFSSSSEEEMFHHVKACHLREFTRELRYEELRNRIPSLPAVIYRCGYCPSYVRADDPSNPTEAIIRHIVKVHANDQIRFSVVTDTGEIREHVIRNLPRVHRCKLCSHQFENFDGTVVLNHLAQEHRGKLFDLC